MDIRAEAGVGHHILMVTKYEATVMSHSFWIINTSTNKKRKTRKSLEHRQYAWMLHGNYGIKQHTACRALMEEGQEGNSGTRKDRSKHTGSLAVTVQP